MRLHQSWLLTPIAPQFCGVLTLTLLPACRSETSAPATLEWPSERCFCCWLAGMHCDREAGLWCPSALTGCLRGLKFTRLRCAAG